MGRRTQLKLNRREDVAVGNENWDKEGGSVRFAFQNVNGLGFDDDQVKLQRIFNFLKKYKIDKLGIAEANTYWPKINKDKRLGDKRRGWFEGLNVNS